MALLVLSYYETMKRREMNSILHDFAPERGDGLVDQSGYTRPPALCDHNYYEIAFIALIASKSSQFISANVFNVRIFVFPDLIRVFITSTWFKLTYTGALKALLFMVWIMTQNFWALFYHEKFKFSRERSLELPAEIGLASKAFELFGWTRFQAIIRDALLSNQTLEIESFDSIELITVWSHWLSIVGYHTDATYRKSTD